jgi:hypothetical protein
MNCQQCSTNQGSGRSLETCARAAEVQFKAKINESASHNVLTEPYLRADLRHRPVQAVMATSSAS